MTVIAEMDVKKDSRNRITLPPGAEFEHYHIKAFEDGHLELYPRVLADPLISVRTLEMMDNAMARLAQGEAGEPVDPNGLLATVEYTKVKANKVTAVEETRDPKRTKGTDSAPSVTRRRRIILD